MNKIKLSGKMSFKQERLTDSGKIITDFSLGFYNGKDKEQKNTYASINVKYFDKTNLVNGDSIMIDGWLKGYDYINRDGQNKKGININATEIKEYKKENDNYEEK